jgi:hypothetical protein
MRGRATRLSMNFSRNSETSGPTRSTFTGARIRFLHLGRGRDYSLCSRGLRARRCLPWLRSRPVFGTTLGLLTNFVVGADGGKASEPSLHAGHSGIRATGCGLGVEPRR